jgi:hypothetical protein
MVHLASQLLGEATGKPDSEGGKQTGSAHNEKHIKAAKGIQRLKARGHGKVEMLKS